MLQDLVRNRARTALIILAIAIGLVGVSSTFRARAVVSDNMAQQLAANGSSHATIRTEGADESVVAAVARLEGVAAAEGRIQTFGRIAVGTELQPIQLSISDDLSSRALDRLRHDRGSWPPPPGTIAIERSTLAGAGLSIGDTTSIVGPSGQSYDLPVSATVHDLTVVSGNLVDRVIYGYLSTETWEELGEAQGFNQIAITVTGDPGDRVRVTQIAQRVEEALAADLGLPQRGVQVPAPGTHILDSIVESMLLILGSLGVLSLILSSFLVFNTVNAVLARQRSQIGIMKAVGGSRNDVLSIYLASIVAYGAAAYAVALPIGLVVSRLLAQQLGALLNVDVVDFSVPAWIWILELSVALLVPLAAALGPIINATRTTVAEALFEGSQRVIGNRRIDRVLQKLTVVSASTRYGTRNTFRNGLRLTLTVVALSLGGAILVAVLSLRGSMFATIDSVADYWRQDATAELQTPVLNETALTLAQRVPGVRHAEAWLITPASIARPDSTLASEESVVFAIPAATEFISPTLIEGRWLDPNAANEAVINVEIAASEPNLKIGDELVMRFAGRERRWRLVGISTTQLVVPGAPRPSAPIVYVPLSSLWEAAGGAPVVNRVVIGSDGTQTEQVLSDRLDSTLEAAGVTVRTSATRPNTLAQVEAVTTPILLLLGAMAALFALVGSLALLGTMSLNVLERTRELGMVRAVGAERRAIRSIVLVEGLTVALLSWVLGSLLSVPIAWVMGRAIGMTFIKVPLDFRFAPYTMLVWLAVVIVTALAASLVPARAAARLSVRDAIAYE